MCHLTVNAPFVQCWLVCNKNKFITFVYTGLCIGGMSMAMIFCVTMTALY